MPIITPEELAGREVDYLVIGGGTAGLAVAARLSEDPDLVVAVLEAGPAAAADDDRVHIPGCFGKGIGTELDWQFETTPQAGLGGRVQPWPRGKVLGGTTYNRGSRQDYDAWEELGNPGWGWDSLLPFFKKAEDFQAPAGGESQSRYKEYYDADALGTGGPVSVSYSRQYSASHEFWHDTLNRLGVATNKRHLSGNNVGVWTNVNSVTTTGERSYSHKAYYLPNAERPNLLVLCEAVVEDLVLEQLGGDWLATGARFAYRGQRHVVSASREVVVSAGTVQSPQILELSGIGDPGILSQAGIEPKVNSPCVGENLQDHFSKSCSTTLAGNQHPDNKSPVTAMIFEMDPTLENRDDLALEAVAAAAMDQYRASKTGLLAILPCSMCYLPMSHIVGDEQLCSLVRQTDALEDIDPERRRIHTRRFDTRDPVGQVEYIFDLGNWSSYFQPDPSSDKKYGTILQVLQYPLSKGHIHIGRADGGAAPGARPRSLEPPTIDPQYFGGAGGAVDFELMTHCARFADTICRTEPLASLIRSRLSPAPAVTSEDEWRAWVRDQTVSDWHPVGTCAMGGRRGIDGGVVDERLRVYGVQRLRVVDASVMPLQISAHLQATVYAIAEKGASLILEDRVPRRQ